MNLIVEKSRSIKWYTDLYPLFSLIESSVRKHAWLWSDIEVGCDLPIPCDERGYCWIHGNDLFEFVCKRPQFVWSVLSAIPPEKSEVAAKASCIPYADGNSDFWRGKAKLQHPMAEFEIVCWDASATLLIGADSVLSEAFRLAYPDAEEFDDRQ